VLTAQPLPQDEGVLRADGDDEGQAEPETGEGGEYGGRHATKLGSALDEAKRKVLQRR
jgi:hypothetical protein